MKKFLAAVLVVAVVLGAAALFVPRTSDAQALSQNSAARTFTSTNGATYTSGYAFTSPLVKLGSPSAGYGGLWLGNVTPSTTNYFAAGNGTDVYFYGAGSGGTYTFSVNGNSKATIDAVGALRLGISNSSACSACSSAVRGRICYVGSGAGVKDTVTVCAKDATDTYAERVVY